MRILVDGDACPNKEKIYQLSQQYHKEMVVYVDYAHIICNRGYRVVECEVGKDSVDMMLLNDVKAGDLVLTQDYGLSSMVLGKGDRVLHVSGKEITASNIEYLLMTRYICAKQRRAHQHIKGPSKRTSIVEKEFLTNLENILKES